MIAQKRLKGVLIFLIVFHALCSCMSGTQKIYSQWDLNAEQAVQSMENLQNFPWVMLLFSAIQIVLLLCNQNVLQLFAAIGASGSSLFLPLRVYVLNLINDNIYFVRGILPHNHYELIITPMGYAAMALSAVIIVCSYVLAVKYRHRRPSEEIEQEEERDGVAV